MLTKYLGLEKTFRRSGSIRDRLVHSQCHKSEDKTTGSIRTVPLWNLWFLSLVDRGILSLPPQWPYSPLTASYLMPDQRSDIYHLLSMWSILRWQNDKAILEEDEGPCPLCHQWTSDHYYWPPWWPLDTNMILSFSSLPPLIVSIRILEGAILGPSKGDSTGIQVEGYYLPRFERHVKL